MKRINKLKRVLAFLMLAALFPALSGISDAVAAENSLIAGVYIDFFDAAGNYCGNFVWNPAEDGEETAFSPGAAAVAMSVSPVLAENADAFSASVGGEPYTAETTVALADVLITATGGTTVQTFTAHFDGKQASSPEAALASLYVGPLDAQGAALTGQMWCENLQEEMSCVLPCNAQSVYICAEAESEEATITLASGGESITATGIAEWTLPADTTTVTISIVSGDQTAQAAYELAYTLAGALSDDANLEHVSITAMDDWYEELDTAAFDDVQSANTVPVPADATMLSVEVIPADLDFASFTIALDGSLYEIDEGLLLIMPALPFELEVTVTAQNGRSVVYSFQIEERLLFSGDVDGDGLVGIPDALHICRHIANIAPLADSAFARADINSDANVDVADLVQICRSIVGLE